MRELEGRGRAPNIKGDEGDGNERKNRAEYKGLVICK